MQPIFATGLMTLVMVANQVGASPGSGDARHGLCSAIPEVSPLELVQHAARYYDSKVCVRGSVGEVVNPNVFSLSIGDDPALDLLVLMPATSSELQRGASVRVIGVVREFMRADGPESGHTPGRLQSRPVIIAESVRADSGEELVIQPDSPR